MRACFAGRAVSARFAERYRRRQGPLVRWWNYLGPNTHLYVLSLAVVLHRYDWALYAEWIYLLYAALLSWRQHFICRRLRGDLAVEWGEIPGDAPARMALEEILR